MGGIVKSVTKAVTSLLGQDAPLAPAPIVVTPPPAPAAAPPVQAVPAAIRRTTVPDTSGLASPRSRTTRAGRASTVLTANLDDAKLGG